MIFNIGENIKKLRAEKGVTQEQLAEHLSITYQSVSKWENNITAPDLYLIPSIAEYFELPIDELFKPNMKGYKNKAERLAALYGFHKTNENFDKAEAEYEKLVEENNADAEDYRLFGIFYQFRAQDLNKKAEEMLKKSIEMGCERSEGQLIFLLSSQGRNHENIEKYEDRLKNNHENVRSWCLLADSYGLESEKGAELVKKGLAKFPNDAGLLYRQAEIYKSQKNYDTAIEYYKKSIEQNPDMGQNFYALAFLYKNMKQYKGAIWAWEEVIALHNRLALPDMDTEWPKQEIAKLQALIDNSTV